MNQTNDELAAIAYDAYGAVTDHKNYQGLPMPKFEDLPETIRQAWGAAVGAVRNRPCVEFGKGELQVGQISSTPALHFHLAGVDDISVIYALGDALSMVYGTKAESE